MGQLHTTVKLAGDHLCVAAGALDALRRQPKYKAHLIGEGIDDKRWFALIYIAEVPHFADLITGTVYDKDGHHHNSSMHVIGLPVVELVVDGVGVV
jgi:hypothetical protein